MLLLVAICKYLMYNKCMIKKEIIVEKDKKLVDLLQDYGFSYADVNKMFRNKDVKLNGKPQRQNVQLSAGDSVVFFYIPEMLEKKYKKVFESDDAVVVYKSAGIEVEGEKGLESVLNAIAVHRLDRNTEGLMVFAKNQTTAKKLENAFKNSAVHKYYIAEVVGNLNTPKKTFSAYLQKDSDASLVKVFQNPVKGAVEIKTSIKTLKNAAESSMVEVELLTGKTHQIRAHLAFLGHPIIGDGKYGKNEINKKFQQKRQKLACFKLKFDFLGVESLNYQLFELKPSWFVL